MTLLDALARSADRAPIVERMLAEQETPGDLEHGMGPAPEGEPDREDVYSS